MIIKELKQRYCRAFTFGLFSSRVRKTPARWTFCILNGDEVERANVPPSVREIRRTLPPLVSTRSEEVDGNVRDAADSPRTLKIRGPTLKLNLTSKRLATLASSLRFLFPRTRPFLSFRG